MSSRSRHQIGCTLDDSLRRYEAMAASVEEGNIVGLPQMQQLAIAGDPLGIGQETVYAEPDAGLIHFVFRPGPDSPLSPHLTPVTFTWDDLVAPIPE